MTTVQAPAEERRGWLQRVHDTLAKPDREAQTLLSGHRVHLLAPQNIIWGTVAGLAGACAVAGGYWALLEQHWYIHIVIGHFIFNHGSGLKLWWDHLFPGKDWPLYRHGLRDLGEPAVAGMWVRTLLASSKYWGVRVRTWRLVTAPLFLVVMAVALITGGIYVLDFGGPLAWVHVATVLHHPGYKLSLGFLGRLSLGTLVLGVLIGQVLHRFWAPIGATLQGYLVDRAVDKAQSPGGHVPLWEKLPVAPPTLRLRFARMYRTNTDITVREGSNHRKVYAAAIAVTVVVTILGVLAKFPIAHGAHIWYLNP